jgi:putative two-component system response regulator
MTANRSSKILIVDDELANVRLLERLLRDRGYGETTSTTDPHQVEELVQTIDPDLVLLDLHMPGLDGYTLLERLRAKVVPMTNLPVLVLTADVTPAARERALSLGAKDFLTKPFDRTEVVLRVNNLLETSALQRALTASNRHLEKRVQERTTELWETIRRLVESETETRLSQEDTIRRLAIAAEFRDDDTAQHIHRMSHYCHVLARRAGLDRAHCERIRISSEMHDVGKIGIPDSILLKPGKLSAGERAIMEGHAEIGNRILEGSRSALLQLAATIALSHHERYDGSGYPRGLKGNGILLEARIASVADVFDALTSDRIYRKALTLDHSLQLMREGQGTQFDPQLLELFLGSLDEILAIRNQWMSPSAVAVRPTSELDNASAS